LLVPCLPQQSFENVCGTLLFSWPKEKEEKYWLVLETPAERKSRLISLYIVHSAMLVFSLGFSIVLTGIIP
jgi:hypothetical protein